MGSPRLTGGVLQFTRRKHDTCYGGRENARRGDIHRNRRNFRRDLAKNLKWLANQVPSGAKIYDIGLDASRGRRTGVFFKAEVAFMEKMGYTRKFVKTVEIDGRTYRMYEWVAK